MRGIGCWFCLIVALVPSVAWADVAPPAPRIPGTGVVVRPFAAGVAAILLSAAAVTGGWWVARNQGNPIRIAVGLACFVVIGGAVAFYLWSASVERARLNRRWTPPPQVIPVPKSTLD